MHAIAHKDSFSRKIPQRVAGKRIGGGHEGVLPMRAGKVLRNGGRRGKSRELAEGELAESRALKRPVDEAQRGEADAVQLGEHGQAFRRRQAGARGVLRFVERFFPDNGPVHHFWALAMSA